MWIMLLWPLSSAPSVAMPSRRWVPDALAKPCSSRRVSAKFVEEHRIRRFGRDHEIDFLALAGLEQQAVLAHLLALVGGVEFLFLRDVPLDQAHPERCAGRLHPLQSLSADAGQPHGKPCERDVQPLRLARVDRGGRQRCNSEADQADTVDTDHGCHAHEGRVDQRVAQGQGRKAVERQAACKLAERHQRRKSQGLQQTTVRAAKPQPRHGAPGKGGNGREHGEVDQ
jgi:hypothetical protein